MDEIYIPLAKEVSGVTYEMVDRFSAYAEALSLSIVDDKDKRGSFIAMAKYILKRTTKQSNDVDKLFSTLQKVTLTLVEGQLKQFTTEDRLPSLTRVLKQAAETKARTFDNVWTKEIKRQSAQLRNMIEMHKSTLRKLTTIQELCWENESKYRNINQTISTLAESDEEQIERLSNRLSLLSEMISSCHFAYKNKVESECASRNNLHKMSEDLCILVKNRIAERLVFGINSLRDVIGRFNDVDRYEECLNLVGEINLPNIVTSILKTSSEKYVCPRIKDYDEKYEFQNHLPAGKIVPGTDVIIENVQTKDRKNKWKECKHEEDVEITKSQSQPGSSDEGTEIFHEVQDADEDEKTDAESSDDDQDTSDASPSGVVKIGKFRTYVTVPENVIDRAPGLLKLKKGLRIKQKVEFSDVELSFGWCRPRILSRKIWGFYYKGQVLESDKTDTKPL